MSSVASAAGSTNLPAPLTPLIGREREIVALIDLVRREDVRLLTLTGPGGVGKTRLALAIAAALRPELADGVAFVNLAPITDPNLVLSAIAHAVGMPRSGEQQPVDELKAFLREDETLLVLDNFEQILSAAPLLVDLLASCPMLKVLVTSRAALRVYGERTVPVSPLALPGDPEAEGYRLPLGEVAESAAVRLFVARAQSVRDGFQLTGKNAPAVAAICRHLDGLPLAIELAAARIRVLSPPALLERLERRLPLLAGGARDQPERLRTMHGAIAWSYDLLSPEEQTLFRRLAVFAGSFNVDAAETVAARDECDPTTGGPLAPGAQVDVLEAITALVDQSLLRQEERPGPGGEPELRFAMLATIREYGLERLAESDEEEATRRRHAAYCLSLVDQAGAGIRSDWSPWLDRLDADHDNLRAALGWAIAHAPATALRLAAGLGRYWVERGHWVEGRDWLDRALTACPPNGDNAVAAARAGALVAVGRLALEQGDARHARRSLEAGLELWQRLDDQPGIAQTLRGLGTVASNQGDYAHAAALFEQALARFRALGDRASAARCLNDLGVVAFRRGDQDGAIAFQEQALAASREAGDEWQAAILLGNLGAAYDKRGDHERGAALTEEALLASRRLGDKLGLAVNLFNLGNYARRRSELEAATASYQECLAVTGELGEKRLASRALDGLALAVAARAPRSAVHLLAAAAAWREAIADALDPDEETERNDGMRLARQRLGAVAYEVAWAAGRALSPDEAVAEALAITTLPPGQPTPPDAPVPPLSAPSPTDYGLTPREIEVLRLLVEGRPDKEIAESLFISRRSASKYVSAILGKLGVDSRGAAAVRAVRDHLV